MNINVRFNIDKAYKKGTNPKIIKRHLYQRKVNPKHLRTEAITIYLWVSVMGDYFKVHSTHKIPPKHWDFNNKRPKRTYEHFTAIDTLLSRMKSNVESNILNAQIKNPTLTFEEIQEIVKNTVNDNNPRPKNNSFFEVLDLFITSKEKEVGSKSMQKYNSFRKMLLEFKTDTGFNVTFHNINSDFETAFKNYLASRKLINPTIGKYFQSVKVFMRWAVEREYTNNEAYKRFKPIKYSSDVIFISQEELEAIIAVDLSKNPGLSVVRDVFVFQCHTGQRYGDIRKLAYAEIKLSKDGYEWHLYQQKGDKPDKVVIPIMEHAERILLQYYDSEKDRIFPAISNQKANNYIKEVCKKAGINEPIHQVKYRGKEAVIIDKPKYAFISTHTARRTFVTLSMEKGMNPETIMKITGHESYSTMKLYKKVVDKFVRSEYKKAWVKKDGTTEVSELPQSGLSTASK